MLALHEDYWKITNNGNNLKNVFAVMLNICGLPEPSLIWNLYKGNYSEDFYRRRRNIN